MRGLTLFISDLRKCRGKDEELKRINKELANIRSKFKGDKTLNGYDKKKYVSKLLFIFLLGYDCDFGHMEAVNLLSSNAYSEKQIGYLFISVIMREEHKLMPLVANAIKNDLFSENNVFQNLALQYLANNSTIDLANSLLHKVQDILISNNTGEFLKQTAALTLLQLLRLKPEFVFDDLEAIRIIKLISHYNLGIMTASASLLEHLAKNFTSQYEPCVPHCIVRLFRIVTLQDLQELKDYTYYSVAAPWITVKLLRILENYSLPADVRLKARLRESLEVILNKAQDPHKSKRLQHSNAKYAVIFEAISFIFQKEFDKPLLLKAACILGSALNQKEAIHRFLALDMMTQLSNVEIYQEHLSSQWKPVLSTLRGEPDISIKKRAVDLLYIICNKNNVKTIIDEMLCFLEQEHDYLEDVALKTAALAEKFGVNSQLYFDTIFSMLQICGDKVDDSIWYTLVKTVVNNDNIQEYAARAAYSALQITPCYDIVIKVAGYILGEFGYLIARDPPSSHMMQLNMLKVKYAISSLPTRALLLTTFLKFLNIYPDLKSHVQFIFKDKCNVESENEEIQQRAIEYLRLSEIASTRVLAVILDEMPSNILQKSAVVAKIQQNRFHSSSTMQLERSLSKKNLLQYRSHCNLALAPEHSRAEKVHIARSVSQDNLRDDDGSNFKLLTNLFKDVPLVNAVSETMPMITISSSKITNVCHNQVFLHNLLFIENAVLYEDNDIRILVECEFKKHFGRFHLEYVNKVKSDLFNVVVKEHFANTENKCSIWFKPNSSILHFHETMQQDIYLECLSNFTARPHINLAFSSNKGHRDIKVILPLTLNKFVEPANMTLEDFNKRWKNYDMGCHEVVKEITANYPMVYAITRQKLKGFRVAVIDDTDAESEKFNCAGIFYTRLNRTGFLVRLIRHPYANKYFSTVRSNQLSLSQDISDLLFELL